MDYEDTIDFLYNKGSVGKLTKNKECQDKTKKVLIKGIDDDWFTEMPLTEYDLNSRNTYNLHFNEFIITLSINEMNMLVSLL
jgi:hypothetical protein